MNEIPSIQIRFPKPTNHLHPWIEWKSVVMPEKRLPPGSVVDITDQKGTWCGRGFFNGHARIRLRVLTTDPQELIDDVFFQKRLATAFEKRRQLGIVNTTNAYRLVHGEADGLGGVVIDQLGEWTVLQFLSAGMFRLRESMFKHLKELGLGKEIYYFAERHVQKQESFDCFERQPVAPFTIEENGLKFWVSVGSRHKSGFYLDQRENRLTLAEEAEGKLLDLFCHSGGFAIASVIKGRADKAIGVEKDEAALDLARRNADLNGGGKIGFMQCDLFDPLAVETLGKEIGREFDTVVADPPKQTRSGDDLHSALRRYEEINRTAISFVKPGGRLVTCSCSGRIKLNEFTKAVERAAKKLNRSLVVEKITGASSDHPVAIGLPETSYLKVLWCRVV